MSRSRWILSPRPDFRKCHKLKYFQQVSTLQLCVRCGRVRACYGVVGHLLVTLRRNNPHNFFRRFQSRVGCILARSEGLGQIRFSVSLGVAMKTALLLLFLTAALVVPSHGQNKVPSYSVSFDGGFGCNQNYGYDDGPDVVGTSSCDYPSRAYFANGGQTFVWFPQQPGDTSYFLNKRSYIDSQGNYFLDDVPFSGPIGPASVAGNTWAVGGNNFIYHSGSFFDPTKGALTVWRKVITNVRGDGFVFGYAAAGFPTKNACQPTGSGPLIAEFSGVNNSIVYATYLSSLGFSSVSGIVRDKGGNIYLSGYGPGGGVLAKLSPNLPQRILYLKNLPYAGGPISVDQYSQVYLFSGSLGIPVANAPYPNPGGPGDASIVVLSPKADRVVYASYLGGDMESPVGISVDGGGSASIGGTETAFNAWDGRSLCPNYGTYNDCSEFEYYATFGPLLRSTLPVQLNFHSRRVGTTTVLRLPFKSTGNVPVTVAGTTISGSPFTLGNSCAGVVKPDATCMISVSFTPTSKGVQTGALTVSSDSLDSPQSVQLTGTGQ